MLSARRHLRSISLFVSALITLVTAEASAQPQASSRAGAESTIRVTSVGDVQTTPDRAYVDLGIETTQPTAEAAAAHNARVMERLLAALVRTGVSREEISTSNYSVFPNYLPPPSGQGEPRINGYRVNNTVTVRTDVLGRVGTMIDVALQAGANRVQGVRFDVRDPDAVRARAVERAIQRGRAEAQTIAAGLGVRLGRVLDASTSPEPQRHFQMMDMAKMERSAAMSPGTQIQPGEQTVSAVVTLVYAILH